jgi:hypothetical protein
VTAVIETECGHCREPMRVHVDSDLEHRVLSGGATPLVCTPFVDAARLSPSIIDGF